MRQMDKVKVNRQTNEYWIKWMNKMQNGRINE